MFGHQEVYQNNPFRRGGEKDPYPAGDGDAQQVDNGYVKFIDLDEAGGELTMEKLEELVEQFLGPKPVSNEQRIQETIDAARKAQAGKGGCSNYTEKEAFIKAFLGITIPQKSQQEFPTQSQTVIGLIADAILNRRHEPFWDRAGVLFDRAQAALSTIETYDQLTPEFHDKNLNEARLFVEKELPQQTLPLVEEYNQRQKDIAALRAENADDHELVFTVTGRPWERGLHVVAEVNDVVVFTQDVSSHEELDETYERALKHLSESIKEEEDELEEEFPA